MFEPQLRTNVGTAGVYKNMFWECWKLTILFLKPQEDLMRKIIYGLLVVCAIPTKGHKLRVKIQSPRRK
jgi:hypothetical protein